MDKNTSANKNQFPQNESRVQFIWCKAWWCHHCPMLIYSGLHFGILRKLLCK